MARSKTIDKITPASEMFFVTWYRSLVNMMSVDGWAYTAILSMILVLVLVLVYLFTEKIWKRKIGFFGGIFFLILFVFANVFAYQQRCELTERNGAIVVVPSVPVKETPATNSTSLFYLHEGTRVEITDRSLNQWRGIRLADGREGWLASNQIEQI
jgi:energy-coupling factor transporter transmembrane protein EcfT